MSEQSQEKKKRSRTSLACLRCSRSKAKCEHDQGGTAAPCRRCFRLGLTCEFVGYSPLHAGEKAKGRQKANLSNNNIPSNKNCNSSRQISDKPPTGLKRTTSLDTEFQTAAARGEPATTRRRPPSQARSGIPSSAATSEEFESRLAFALSPPPLLDETEDPAAGTLRTSSNKLGSFDFDHGILQAVSQGLIQKRPRGRPKKLSQAPPISGNTGSGRGDHRDKNFGATHDYHHHDHHHYQESVSEAELERRVRARKAAPLPLLREWALVACRRGDCGLLGRALLLAHSGGLSLSTVLESSATSALEEGASMLARDMTTTTASVLSLARTPRDHSHPQQERQQQQQQLQQFEGQASEEGVGESHNETISAPFRRDTSATSGSLTTTTSSILEPLKLPPSSSSSSSSSSSAPPPTKPVLPESLSWLFRYAEEVDVKDRQQEVEIKGVKAGAQPLETSRLDCAIADDEEEEKEEGATPPHDDDDSDDDYCLDERRKSKRRRRTRTNAAPAALAPSLPASPSSSSSTPTEAAAELTLSPQPLVLVKVVTNGLPSFLFNPLFERFVMSREALSKKADHATPRQPAVGATISGGGSGGDGGNNSGACPSVVTDLDCGAGHTREGQSDFVQKAGAFPSFLHPEDGLLVSELVGRLWKDLAPPSLSTPTFTSTTTTKPPASTLVASSSTTACPDPSSELSSAVELPPGRLRLWMKTPGTAVSSPHYNRHHHQAIRRPKKASQRLLSAPLASTASGAEESDLRSGSDGSFVRCGGKLELVVRTCGGRQTSFLAFAFWPLAAELARLHRRLTSTTQEEEGEEGEAGTAERRVSSSSCSSQPSPLPPTSSSITVPTLSSSCEPDTPPGGTSVAAGRAQPSGDVRAAGPSAAAPTAAEALWLSWTPFDDESLASELGGLLDL